MSSGKKPCGSPGNSGPWYRDGVWFQCTGCGGCCGGAPGYVWVSEDEITALATAAKMSCDKWECRYVRTIASRGKSLVEEKNYDCCLLDPETGRCRFYEHRPQQCRTWPFWRENLTSKSNWKLQTARCPGCTQPQQGKIGTEAGKLFSAAEIETLRDQF